MKILVIRFSSLGDIIYTTPVVRCLKKQIPGAEVHFLTKPAFKYIYEGNPYTDKLLYLKPSLSETIADIKSEQYDYILDLHNNLRTFLIKIRTGIKSSTYKKQPVLKWLSLKFRLKLIEPIHLVNRYMKTVAFLGVKNDEQPIDYYIKGNHQIDALLPTAFQNKYSVFIVGATHFTKRLPNSKIINICKNINNPIVLLGGKDVELNGVEIESKCTNVYNACGKTNLDESVFLLANSACVIGFDTGLTHIAEAFSLPIVSIWGGTVPELLGVQPYKVKNVLIAGIDIDCRPCSKFGLEKCPKGHFKCMNDMPENPIELFANNAANSK